MNRALRSARAGNISRRARVHRGTRIGSSAGRIARRARMHRSAKQESPGGRTRSLLSASGTRGETVTVAGACLEPRVPVLPIRPPRGYNQHCPPSFSARRVPGLAGFRCGRTSAGPTTDSAGAISTGAAQAALRAIEKSCEMPHAHDGAARTHPASAAADEKAPRSTAAPASSSSSRSNWSRRTAHAAARSARAGGRRTS
jgi:hypothetical protein